MSESPPAHKAGERGVRAKCHVGYTNGHRFRENKFTPILLWFLGRGIHNPEYFDYYTGPSLGKFCLYDVEAQGEKSRWKMNGNRPGLSHGWE